MWKPGDKERRRTMWEPGEEDRRKSVPFICNPDTCQYHHLTQSVITDLKDAVAKILEGQAQMRDTVISLVETVKGFDRIDARIEKLEADRKEHEKLQDEQIDGLRIFMYKAMGIIGVLVVVAGFLVRIFFGA
jgi:hypothetical protein